MHRFGVSLALVTTFALAALASPARADGHAPDAEFLLGIGYARVNFDDDAFGLVDDRDGIYFDPVFSAAFFDAVPPLRLGAAVGVFVALDDVRGTAVVDDGELIAVSGGDTSLVLAEPEVRVSWRQHFGEDDVAFLEAGAGAGGVFGWLDAGDGEDEEGPDDGDLEETDGALMARVFLRLGFQVTGGLAGIEASYMRGGKMEFGDAVGGEVEEYYLGIFGALKF